MWTKPTVWAEARTRWLATSLVEGWRKRVDLDKRVASEERLDRLLEKINREGIHALSASERAFLKKVSKRR